MVNRVSVAVNVRFVPRPFLFKIAEFRLEVIHHLVSGLRVNALVIVPRIVVPPELLPMLLHNVLHRDELSFGRLGVPLCKYAQPSENGPDSVLFSDVVRACAKALLSAELDFPRIHEISKEFPPGWRFVLVDAQLGGNFVNGSAGGHAPCDSKDLLVGEDGLRVGSQKGKRVGGGNEKLPRENHIAIRIAIAGRPKIRDLRTLGFLLKRIHQFHQLFCIH